MYCHNLPKHIKTMKGWQIIVRINSIYPFYGSENVNKFGYKNGKQRYKCNNIECTHKTFFAEYTYNGCKPNVDKEIIKLSVEGMGIRSIARKLRISTGTVISVLKKEEVLDYVNKEYINSHDNIKISIEMDEMWSFYHDKHHQIWLWWDIDYNTGEVIAYWFGTREHKTLDKLMELLNPLGIGTVYTDGNYAYFKHFSYDKLVLTKKNTQKIERKHLSLRTWCARLVRKGIRFSKTEQMHKIVVGLVINYWFFDHFSLTQ